MYKILILLLIFILLIGCATANNVPESERVPNKFDGRWELETKQRFYMYFDIKYGKIVGRMGDITWPAGIHLPIRGIVSPDGEFKFEYAGSLDVTNGFDLEVTNASAERGFIQGNAYDDYNKRYKWAVVRKGKHEYPRPRLSPAQKKTIEEINLTYSLALLNQGVSFEKKSEYDRVIAKYNKAIELNPRLAEAYNNRGGVYFSKGQYDKAISDYTKAIETNPRYAEAYNNRGNAFFYKRENEKAISDYNKAIEMNPNYYYAYIRRGYVYTKIGEFNKAISDYTKATELNPSDAKAYGLRGFAYSFKGQYKKACSDWKRACESGFCKNLESAKRKGYCK